MGFADGLRGFIKRVLVYWCVGVGCLRIERLTLFRFEIWEMVDVGGGSRVLY